MKMSAAEVRTILANPSLFTTDVYRAAVEREKEIARGQV